MVSKLSDKAKAFLFIAIGAACFLLAGGLVYTFPKQEATASKGSVDELYQKISETNGSSPNPAKEWVLYVTGSVKKPGVYHLSEGARIYQLVQAAGGFIPNADEVAVNMAAPLADGSHLHVPQRGERRDVPAGTVSGIEVKVSAKAQLLNLNSANNDELQKLHGIGPALAQRIIQYREENGPFKQVQDLTDVPGIGAKKLEAIAHLLTVK